MLALAVATCTQDNVGPGRGGVGYFSFRPDYQLAGGASLSQFGIVADSVHIRLTRPVDEVVLDTSIAFPADSAELHLALPVVLASTPEVLSAVISISAGGVVIFLDSVDVTVTDGPPGGDPPPVVTFDYIGPGSNIGTLQIAPGDTTVVLGDTVFFTAAAFDSSAAPVVSFYVGWSTSDTSVAKINGNGRLISPANRGTVKVIATTPTGIVDTTTVVFAPVPVIITADSGNAQTGIVGDSLGALFVARVKGADSLGISGIPVRFAAVTAGGAVRDTATLITDAQGRVRTRAVLGTVAQGYSYTATALGTGLPARTFTATATAAAAATIAIQGGNAQTDTVGQTLPLPLTARVTDAFSNPVAGANVVFTRLVGSGTPALDTITTDAAGLAPLPYTLGASEGVDSIRAALVGTSGFVTFSATGVHGAAVAVQTDSGGAQIALPTTPFADSLVARVLDVGGNAVPGLSVQWTVVNGDATLSASVSVTQADGRARVGVTAGDTAGPVLVRATVAGVADTATWSLNVLTGPAAAITITGGNGQTDTIGQTLALPLAVHVTDAFGNDAANAKVYWLRIVGNGSVSSDSSLTDAAGATQVNYTLGGSAGTDSIKATIAGTSTFVTFSATAVSAAPTQIIQVLGGGQSAVVGTTFTDSLAVQILDASDNPVSGIWVHWIVASGSLSLSADSSLSDGTGHAAVRLTAGTVAGPAAAHATVTGIVSPSVFNETVTAGAAASMIIASGDGQSGNAGAVLPLALVVRVLDAFGNRVSGTSVAFAVTSGGGSLDSATATTNASGDASGGSWTLGGTAGGNQVRATSAAVPADTLLFTATGLPAGTSKVWTGAVSNLWGTAGNWSPSGVPAVSDNVFIPAGVTSPFLSSTSNANDLTIESGAVLNTGSFVLNISGNLDAAGTIAGAGFPTMNGASRTLRGSIGSYLGITGSITLIGPFSTSGQLDIASGSLNVGGRTLTIGGNLTVSGSGALIMQNAPDSVLVSGATTYNGSTTAGLLTAGKLVLLGSFSEPSGSAVFRASGTHRTIFAGASPQTVSFGSAGLGGNQFQDVVFANAAGVTLGSNIAAGGTVSITAGVVSGIGRTATLAGALDDPTSAGWDVTSTVLTADPALLPDTLRHDLFVAGNVVLTKDLVIRGNLGHTGGILTMNGSRVRVDSALTVSGSAQLRMQNPADTLDVGGSTSWNGSTTAGLLTTGTLILRGNFSEPSGSAVFRASGSHKTIFAGSAAQSVSFGSSGLGGNQFQDVEFANPAGVTLASNFAAGGTGSVTAGQVAGAGRTATIQGNVVDASNTSWRPDVTVLTGTPTSLPDSFARSLVITGTTILGKPLVVRGNLSQSAGTFNLNGYRVRVDSALTVSGSAQLLMQNPADTLEVLGATSWNGSTTAGLLTAGTLLLRGDFSEPSGSAVFRASGTHRTVFAGTATQSVSFGSSGLGGNQFQDVEFANPAGVTLASSFAAGGTGSVTAGQVVGVGRTATIAGSVIDTTGAAWLPEITVLSGTPGTLPDSFARNLVITGTTILGKPLVVRAGLSQSAGVFTLNGFRVRVDSALTVSGSAQLRMQNPADTLDVAGATSWNGATTAGLLTAGTLILRGDFSEPSGSAVFRASGTHRTLFAGSAAQSVSFGSSGLGGNQFQDVEFANTAGVTLATNIAAAGTGSVTAGQVSGTTTATVAGNIVDTSNVSWRPAFTILTGTPTSLPDSLARNVTISGTVLLGKPLVVGGNLSQTAGTFTLNGFSVRVDSGLTISGSAQLIMQNAADSLDVAGTVSWNGSTAAGLLTDGTLVLRGDFSEPSGSTVFQPSGGHRTRFAGGTPQTVTFASAGFTANRFHHLVLAGAGAVTLNSNVFATGTLTKGVGAPATVAGTGAYRTLAVRGLALDGVVFDSVRLTKSGPATTTFNNVTFQRQDPTAIQLVLTDPGTPAPVSFTGVQFSTTPSTGKYLSVADTAANGEPVHLLMVQSTPLDGSAFETQVGGGDGTQIDWSSMGFAVQPLDAPAGDTLAPFQVAVLNPAGDTATFYSGNVTLAIGTNPGGGTLTGTTTVAAAGGIATFNDIAISSAGAGYTLNASATGLTTVTSVPFNVSVPLPVGTTTAFNNGGGDNDWFNGANWTAGTPDSLDNVFIYPAQTVTVNAPARANRVVVGTGGGIVLNATLTVDSSVAAGNTITGGGQLIAQGNGTLGGQVGDLLITGSYSVTPGGHLRAQTLVIDGIASLNVLADSVTVTDSLATQNSGVLNINGAGAVVDVGGDLRLGGGTSVLAAGVLILHGGLYTASGTALTSVPSFSISFEGAGMQTVLLTGADSTNALPSVGMQGDSLTFASPVWVAGGLNFGAGVTTIDSTLFAPQGVAGSPGAELRGNTLWNGGAFTFAGNYSVHNTIFAGSAVTIPALATPYDTLYVSGTAQLSTDLAANAFFVIGAGSFELAGNRVDVTGDFGTLGTATFRMTDPADTLMVGGSFYASGGSTTGLLTDGLLQVAGNFIQGNYIPCCVEIIVTGPLPAFDAFNADTGLVTRLTGGTGTRFIFFSNPLDPTAPPGTSSKFGTLELVDGSDSLYSSVPVLGTTTMTSGELVGPGTLAAAGPLTVLPGVASFAPASLYSGAGIDYQAPTITYNVAETFFFGGDSIPALPYQWLRVGFTTMALTSDLTVGQVTLGGQGSGPLDSYNGDLDLNGHALTVTGAFTTEGFGRVRMVAAADSLDVSGTMNLGGGDMTGMITDGAIVARGNVTLNPGWTDTSFVAAGNNRFRIDAALGAADLAITQSPGDPLRFAKFTLASGTNLQFNQFTNGALVASDSLVIAGLINEGSSGQKVRALGAFVATGSLTVSELEVFTTYDNTGGTHAFTTTFAGTGQTIPVNGYETLKVHGDATLAGDLSGGNQLGNSLWVENGGTLTLGGNALQMLGAASVLTDGLLVMTDPGDTLWTVYGVTFDGRDSEGSLTDGVIRTNYFIQAASTSARSFRSSGTHRVEMLMDDPSAATTQVTMATGGAAGSFFNDIVLDHGGSPVSALTLSGHVEVMDTFLFAAGAASDMSSGATGTTLHVLGALVIGGGFLPISIDTLDVGGTIQVPTSVLGGGVTRFSGAAPQYVPDTQSYTRLEITGIATPEGTANITAQDLVIYGSGQYQLSGTQTTTLNGDLSTLGSGTLAMSGAPDLFVGGNATFAGGSEVALLTGGILRLVGNFTELPGASNETFTTSNTTVRFQGSTAPQVVTLDPLTIGNFREVEILNGFGIQISGLMVVTDSVGTYGPITGDSLWQFGTLHFNTGVPVTLRNLRTSGVFVGLPSSYTVDRTHIVVGPNTLPNVAFDTLVINAPGIAAFYPLSVNTLIIAATGSSWASGPDGTLDLGSYSGTATHNIAGNVLIEGTGALLSVAEDTVLVGGDLTTALGGTVQMDDPNGLLQITGNTTFGGGSVAGKLTSGTLLLYGDLTQLATSSDSSFAADSGHTTMIGGGGTHVVSFATPDSAGGSGSHFGSLSFESVSGVVLQTSTDLWVEGMLRTTSYSVPTLQNTAPVLRTLTARDVSIQGITFDHLQFHLAKPSLPAVGGGNIDIATFNNFLSTEDQFLVDLPGLSAGPFNWSNFTFTQLAVAGTDAGHYIVATDTDGPSPAALNILIGTNQASDPSNYFVGQNGATVTPFAP